MAKAKPRVRVPKKVSKGEIIEIKTLISHKMESGLRKDQKTGELIPRHIINKFVCKFNGDQVFASDWHPAISANPFIAFMFKADEPGTFVFEWTDDDGSVYTKETKLKLA